MTILKRYHRSKSFPNYIGSRKEFEIFRVYEFKDYSRLVSRIYIDSKAINSDWVKVGEGLNNAIEKYRTSEFSWKK